LRLLNERARDRAVLHVDGFQPFDGLLVSGGVG
jgi:hypothetical protein